MRKLYQKYQDWIELVGSALFVGGLFYLLYFSLWIFCPC